MKIQGLNNKDLEIIDRALCYMMSEQLLRLRQNIQGGEIDRAEPFLESFNDSFSTYKKFQKERSKYGVSTRDFKT